MSYFPMESQRLVPWTVLGATSATISITSIPATYTNLLLVCALRTDRAAAGVDNVYMRFNGDSTASSYYSYSIRRSATTATDTVLERLGVTATGIEFTSSAVGATGTAGYRSFLMIYINDYASTTRHRQVHGFGRMQAANTTGNLFLGEYTGQWQNLAAAISQIDLLPVNGTNFEAGSAYMLSAF